MRFDDLLGDAPLNGAGESHLRVARFASWSPPINLVTEVAQIGVVVALLVVAIRHRRVETIVAEPHVAVDLIGSARG